MVFVLGGSPLRLETLAERAQLVDLHFGTRASPDRSAQRSTRLRTCDDERGAAEGERHAASVRALSSARRGSCEG